MDFFINIDCSGKKKIWWIILFVFMTIFFIGTYLSFSNFDLGNKSYAYELMMLLCSCLLLIFIVPFALFMRFTCRRLQVSKKLPLLALLSGMFVPGWIAGQLNQMGLKAVKLLTSSAFANAWGKAIVGPLSEEGLKLITVLILLYLFDLHQRKSYLITGMNVGMGFQIDEDIGYISSFLKGGSLNHAISLTLNERVVNGFVSHWCYTALITLGVYCLIHRHEIGHGLMLILSMLLIHGFWDSWLGQRNLFLGMMSALAFILFYYEYVTTIQFHGRQSE